MMIRLVTLFPLYVATGYFNRMPFSFRYEFNNNNIRQTIIVRFDSSGKIPICGLPGACAYLKGPPISEQPLSITGQKMALKIGHIRVFY